MKKFVSLLLVFVLLLSMAATAFAAETFEYIVVSGDTLSEIAAKYNTTTKAILELNPKITDASKIKVGDKLIIPVVEATEPVDDGYVHYIVQAGDSLSEIAAKYHTTTSAIMALNPKITDKNAIYAGQDIIVGKKGEVSTDPLPPVDDGYIHYTVVAGDTLTSIAKKFDTTIDKLVELNPTKIPNKETMIVAGWDIKVGLSGTVPPVVDPEVPPVVDPPVVEPEIPALTAPSHVFFEDSISVNFKNTDISDILNVIAQMTGKNIIYAGGAKSLTVKANGTVKAVLEAVCKAEGTLSVLISGNSCFVGPAEALSDTKTPYKEVTKLVTLTNIKAADLVKVLDYLKLPEYTGTVSEDSKKPMEISITATPYNMASVLAAINAIDRAENIVNNSFNWRKLALANLSSAEFEVYAEYFGFGDNVIRDNSTDAVFVCGKAADIDALATIAKLVDKPADITVYLYDSPEAEATLMKFDVSEYAAKAHTKDGKIYLVGTAADIDELYSALEYYRTVEN